MASLPTGTLTLLFSDIEGSTALLHRLGDRWGEALSAHRVIVRDAIATFDGVEMGTEGDSFFVVFTTAQHAVAAAIAAQRALQSHDWPDGAQLRVRMGIHTGEPQRHEDGYIGEDVHRAARIGSTAHGAQIVVSAATQALLPTPPGASWRDLGHHRLKDMPDEAQLYDVVVPGLVDEFPPLRSLGRVSALPAWTTPLVGRDDDLARLRGLSGDPATRLTTLTGPGGSGKTRVAVALAADLAGGYPDGVFFVALNRARDATAMWQLVADELDAGGGSGPDRSAVVLDRLRPRRLLLVLDNVEQIDGADAVVADLLATAPGVDVLATSRRALLLVAEREFPLAPLALPASPDLDAVLGSAAAAMFAQQARLARPSFEITAGNSAAVAELCGRLDGLPLAIELAAAQTRLLGPAALIERLDGTLGRSFRAADRPERQRTLDDVVRWSYELLDEPDRALFRHLGVFERDADLDAVVAVAAGAEPDETLDAVARLVTANVVQVEDGPDSQPRISMLETIRSFARGRLGESGDGPDTRTRHLTWCLDTVERTVPVLGGSLHTVALDRLTAIDEDVQAALEFALDTSGAPDADRLAVGHQLLITIATRYWYRFGRAAEARAWQERALASGDDRDSATNVGLLFGLGVSLLVQSAVADAVELLTRSLDMSRRLGLRPWQARILNTLAVAHRQAGEFETAVTLLHESLALARDDGNAEIEAKALGNLAVLHHDLGDYEQAAQAAEQSRQLNTARGDDWAVAIDRINHTAAVLHTEGAAAAAALVAEWLPSALVFGETELMIDVLELAGAIASELGRPTVATWLLAAADARRTSLGMPRTTAEDGRVTSWSVVDRRMLSADDWAAAYEAGSTMTTDRLAGVIGGIGATQTSV